MKFGKNINDNIYNDNNANANEYVMFIRCVSWGNILCVDMFVDFFSERIVAWLQKFASSHIKKWIIPWFLMHLFVQI